jgi:hypothetical protein
VRCGQFPHLPLLHLAAESLAKLMGSPLDYGVVRDSFDGPIGPAQFNLGIGCLAEELLQPLPQLGYPCPIRRFRRILSSTNSFRDIHDRLPFQENPSPKHATAYSLPENPQFLLLTFLGPCQLAQKLGCTRIKGSGVFDIDMRMKG